jgi:hypothetical protein
MCCLARAIVDLKKYGATVIAMAILRKTFCSAISSTTDLNWD